MDGSMQCYANHSKSMYAYIRLKHVCVCVDTVLVPITSHVWMDDSRIAWVSVIQFHSSRMNQKSNPSHQITSHGLSSTIRIVRTVLLISKKSELKMHARYELTIVSTKTLEMIARFTTKIRSNFTICPV